MCAKAAVNVKDIQDNSSHETPTEMFRKRQSKELVIAFSGPLGCGLDTPKSEVSQLLGKLGYAVVPIKISEFIQSAIDSRLISLPKPVSDYPPGDAGRINMLQDGGNELRKHFETADILAEFAVRKIAAHRTSTIPRDQKLETHVPKPTAYIIDQLKNPAEVALFRTVYRNLFYLIGVLSVRERREKRLLDKSIDPGEVARLIKRDRKEPTDHGQQLDKTLELADFFVRNDHPNSDAIRDSLSRFLRLIHGYNGLSPTQEEYGMYVAYAAGLRSACLSRQVGAAILDDKGNVLATGRNDVPRPGGGLYGPENGSLDARCVKQEGHLCHNEKQKKSLRANVEQILTEKLTGKDIATADISRIADSIYQETRMKDLTEFSRSIHAEMDAVVSLARATSASSIGATLFVTTYPCHNCARHLVAAGIGRVYYIEPYEKSLAVSLHSDSISSDPEATELRKLAFIHFEGVAPRQYLNLFRQHGERKSNGVAVENSGDLEKVVPEYLDDYQDFEAKVVTHLTSLINSPAPNSGIAA
jgi:deoxycytidylate deaminase